jgi:hypothetical protein
MERKQPAAKNPLSEALHRRVDRLELSGEARDRILASAPRTEIPGAGHYWPGLAWAAAACLLIAGLGVVRLRSSKPEPPHTLFKCVAVMYTDETHVDWTKRTIIVRKTNGEQTYIKIVATKPQGKEKQT